ncbi:MAG TPA: glycosyltransferase family 2 protein [Gemmatimonadota bacterium]|nr:glycosyltransferase family 2 protein [Gemmatimonadota bacterium]
MPAHDEEPRIGAVVHGALRHLPVIVVDDGSADATARVAEAAGAKVLRRSPNQGKGAALRTGFRLALAEGVDAAVTLDADGQHDPAEIPKLVAAFETGRPELVIGCRDFGAMPPLRRLANTLGSLVLRLALGVRVRDNQSGYRLVGRRVMEAMTSSAESGFEFEVEMIAECLRRGWRIDWVPIRTIYAGGPSHIRNRDHLAGFVRTAWRLRRSMRRREPGPEPAGQASPKRSIGP